MPVLHIFTPQAEIKRRLSVVVTVFAMLFSVAFSLAGTVAIHADTIGTDDYPYKNNTPGTTDPWGFPERDSTSFIAWRENSAGVAIQNTGNQWGAASNWEAEALISGYVSDSYPTVGSIAQWNANYDGAGSNGQVAFVDSVNSGGTITVEEYNYTTAYAWDQRTITTYGSSSSPSNFLHLQPTDTNGNSGEYKGDFNGDGYSDVAILHERTDGGADVHALWGASSNALSNSTTYIQSLTAANGWNWSDMKIVAGDFNCDGKTDLAILHKRTDGGADVHVLWGSSSSPLSNTTTYVRSLPGSSGWVWSEMNIVAGDFNGDGCADIGILHQRTDGGADVHVLWGSLSSPLANTTTYVRSLPGSSGWNWSLMKLAPGDYNGDGYSDIAILHERLVNGFDTGDTDVHVLWGAATGALTNTTTYVQTLSSMEWTGLKILPGDFNGDGKTDLALVALDLTHDDDGANIYTLNGSSSSPLGGSPTLQTTLNATSGWSWYGMKLVPGDINGSSSHYDDLTILKERTDGGADIDVLYGGSTPFSTTSFPIRSLPASSGWNWSEMKQS